MVIVRTRREFVLFVLIVGVSVFAPAGGMAQSTPRTDYLGDSLPEGAIARLGTARLRHPGAIRSLKFTDDGKSLISYSYNEMPMVWDVETGKRSHREGVPRHLLFDQFYTSPDQKFIAAIREDATEIELRDKATGKPVLVRGNPSLWSSVAFAQDGKTLLAVSYDHVVTAWDIASGKETSRQSFGPGYRYAKPILSLDGSVLASVLDADSGHPELVRFWDPLTGNEKYKPIWMYWVSDWSFSEDGKRLTVQSPRSAKVEIWDPETGKKTETSKEIRDVGESVIHIRQKKLEVKCGWETVGLQDLESKNVVWQKSVAPPNSAGQGLKTCCVNRLAISPDGKTIAAGTDNGYIELLDLATGERVGGSRLHPGFFSGPFRFVLENKYALVTLGQELVLWDLATGEVIRNLDRETFMDAPTITLDRQSVLQYTYGPNNHGLVLADIMSGRELWGRNDQDKEFSELQFSKDGQTLAVFQTLQQASDVKFASTKTGKDIRKFQPRIADRKTDKMIPPGFVIAVSDEMLVALQPTDRATIQLWDPVANKQLWKWAVPSDCFENSWYVHFVPGGRYMVAETHIRQGSDVYLYLLDAKTGKQLEGIHGWDPQGISSNGRFIAFNVSTGEKDYHLEVRDLSTGEAALKLRSAYYGRFSADSKIFACARDNAIEFYDLQTKQRLGSPRPHPARIWEMTFAPSGSILSVCYNDSTVILWDAKFDGKSE